MARLPAFSAGDRATYLVALEAGVTGYGTNTPPGSPAANETYIVGTSPTGAWVGSENKIASYISATWTFLPASGAIGTSQRGLRVGGAASDVFYLFNGTAWTSYAAPTRLVDHQNTIDPLPQYLMRYEATSGGGGTDLSYTAATRIIASSSGADATLPLVSSADAGLAPASGGGTANFLRADASWASVGTGLVIENRTSDPGAPSTGQIWLRTDL